MAKYGSDASNPNYTESVASLKRKTKEDIRIDQLIPPGILENSGDTGIKQLLEHYYKFMNMDEFIYQETETHTDVVASGLARFRIPDPNNENNTFFTDDDGSNSTLKVTDSLGNSTTITLSSTNVQISNGNELPGTLANSTSEIGKTFTVSGLSSHNTKTAALTTIVKYWVGPGPSYILNAIEEAMNIDENTDDYLELMQKEIAASIPRDLKVDKRSLYKNITDFYKLRGTQDSIEIFFRLLFNESVEVDYPWDKTLIPSEGNWDTGLERYLDHKGFLSDKIKLQDSYFYQKFSYLIRTGKNLTDWGPAFDRLVHPAGFIFFGEILILTQLTRAILGDNDRISSYMVGTGPSATTNDGAGEVMVPASVLGGSYTDPTNVIYRYKDVYGRTNRKTLSSMPGLQPGVIGLEDLMLLVEAFASTFLPNVVARINKSATLSTTISNAGVIDGVTSVQKGWGYTTAPTTANNGLTVTGDGSGAVITTTLDGNGSIDTITVSNGGSNFTTAYVAVTAAPNVGKIQNLYLSNLADKTYTTAPVLTLEAPTSTDQDGNLLVSNVTATATVQLDAEGEISGFTVTNVGNGYVLDPKIHVSSPTSSEGRGKEVKEIAIIMLNHIANIDAGPYSTGFKTIEENNYFNRKENAYYAKKKWRDNYPISFFSSNIIKNTYTTSINSYNVNSTINQE